MDQSLTSESPDREHIRLLIRYLRAKAALFRMRARQCEERADELERETTHSNEPPCRHQCPQSQTESAPLGFTHAHRSPKESCPKARKKEASMPEIAIRKLTDEELESLKDEMYGKLEGLNKDDARQILEILIERVNEFSFVGPKNEE